MSNQVEVAVVGGVALLVGVVFLRSRPQPCTCTLTAAQLAQPQRSPGDCPTGTAPQTCHVVTTPSWNGPDSRSCVCQCVTPSGQQVPAYPGDAYELASYASQHGGAQRPDQWTAVCAGWGG